jgi:hypothetical protein
VTAVAKPGTKEVEGEELLAPRGRAPHLDKLTAYDGDGDKLAVGAEADGGGGFLEGDVVEYGAVAEIGVENAALVVRDDDELPLTGGGELADVERLEGEEEAARSVLLQIWRLPRSM